MIVQETSLAGAFVVDIERVEDQRGFFARAFCQREFAASGLQSSFVQVNMAFNRRRGTVRGMHYQYPPYAEVKLVRVTRGRIVDVIVDLRPESPTFLQHLSVELSAENHRSLYVPERFAHGYQALEDGTEMTYQVSQFYSPAADGGIAPLDPRLGIGWPLPVTEISEKDARRPLLDLAEPELKRRMSL